MVHGVAHQPLKCLTHQRRELLFCVGYGDALKSLAHFSPKKWITPQAPLFWFAGEQIGNTASVVLRHIKT